MSRGLCEITRKWESGNEAERAVARELRELEQKRVAPEEYLPILFRLQNSQMLSNSAVFCIITDLLERNASTKAEEAIGTWEDYEDNLRDARGELREQIEGVIASFLSRNPLPPGEVLGVLSDLIEGPSWKETVQTYSQRMAAATSEILPELFRQHGLTEMADLFEQCPEDFKKIKESGERYLIGQTYTEENETLFRNVFARTEREGD